MNFVDLGQMHLDIPHWEKEIPCEQYKKSPPKYICKYSRVPMATSLNWTEREKREERGVLLSTRPSKHRQKRGMTTEAVFLVKKMFATLKQLIYTAIHTFFSLLPLRSLFKIGKEREKTNNGNLTKKIKQFVFN